MNHSKLLWAGLATTLLSSPISLSQAASPTESVSTTSTTEVVEVETAQEEMDEDELMLIELRRRALEAELAEEEGDIGPGSSELAMSTEELDAMSELLGRLGPLPKHPHYPDDNLPTPERIELGRKLFFDRRLSRDQSMSCATCHDPKKGWSDALPRSIGFGGHELGRHSPTVINTAYNSAQFWDGRASTLEQQAVGPMLAAGEMNMISPEHIISVISEAPQYEGEFEAAYGSGPDMDTIGKAVAAFERTIVTGPSPFDQYSDGDKSALNESQKRGLILFMTTASCTQCHNGPNFTDSKFYSLGVCQAGPLKSDLGRFEHSGDAKDKHAFKTPGLRNIEQSAPYMHDGSLATLEEVVEFYNRGGERDNNRSKLIQPLKLTDSQKSDLVAFLRSLTGPLPLVTAPQGDDFGA